MRRALAIGIDDYPGAPLYGCAADAEAVASLLRRNADDSPNFDVRCVTDPSWLGRTDLRDLVADAFRDPAEAALFFFAGHGAVTELGGYLVTPDATTYGDGVSLVELLAIIRNSPVGHKAVLLDCCFSGAFGQVPAVGTADAGLPDNTAVLTASLATQPAEERAERGVFSSLVCAALEGGAADVLGKVTVASTYAYADQILGPWDQRPTFRANLTTLLPLRVAQESVPRPVLRRLPEWFPDEDHEMPLDPSYEPDAEPRHSMHEQIFGELQKCRASKLVEPVGEEHMYYAAMNSKSCRLTELGRLYWRLANDNRI
jgi:caspase domain-containing protein